MKRQLSPRQVGTLIGEGIKHATDRLKAKQVADESALLDLLSALTERVERLESRQAEALRYCGIWRAGDYTPGSLVTRSGGLWHCEQATNTRPGEGVAWKLIVKKGSLADAE
jgi:hypothetical protein